MGIGIGWPNASAGAAPIIPRTGWFNVIMNCNGETYAELYAWTQQLFDTTLQSGQYAFSPALGTRVLLGTFSETIPDIIVAITIVDEGFNSCPT
jgi:hypothetical protein